jgi:hypothetical protein
MPDASPILEQLQDMSNTSPKFKIAGSWVKHSSNSSASLLPRIQRIRLLLGGIFLNPVNKVQIERGANRKGRLRGGRDHQY